MEKNEIPLLESRKPTHRDLFFLSWGPEMIKNQFSLATELLKQQITICIALLSVSMIFESVLNNNDKLKFFVILTFFLGLLSSFIGLMPFQRQTVCMDSPSDIEKFHDDALKYKQICFLLSGVFIALGIFLIVIKIGILAFS